MTDDMAEVREIAVENSGHGHGNVVLAKAILLLDERLRAVEQLQQSEDIERCEASEHE